MFAEILVRLSLFYQDTITVGFFFLVIDTKSLKVSEKQVLFL